MNLKDAQRLEKSLFRRAGSLSWLANAGRMTNVHTDKIRDIPEVMREDMNNSARILGSHARHIHSRIEKVLETIEVDL